MRRRLFWSLLLLGGCAGAPPALPPWVPGAFPLGKAARVSSFDPTGGNRDYRPLPPGATLLLADLPGPGVITHLWFTTAGPPGHLRDLVLRCTWDETPGPSVAVPLGDFFGVGHGLRRAVRSYFLAATSYGRSLHAYFPMPFARRARLTLQNEGTREVAKVYYHLDYRQLPSPPRPLYYFHAVYRQARPPALGKDYEVLATTGEGFFLGCTVSVLVREPGWWGEGDERLYVDGKLCAHGTGTEDYFGDAWGLRPFQLPFQACTVAEGNFPGARFTAFRFHVLDPIPFRRSFRFLLEHGHGNRRRDHYFSVAYWYQRPPRPRLPPVPPSAERHVPAPPPERVAAARAADEAFFHLEEGRWDAAAAGFARAARLDPRNPRHPYNQACALSRAGRLEEALRALATAVARGFRDRRHLERDPDLAPLRALPAFRKLLRRLPP